MLKGGKESTFSLLDKFAPKEIDRLFQHNFHKDQSFQKVGKSQLDTLRKTVNFLHIRSERKIYSQKRRINEVSYEVSKSKERLKKLSRNNYNQKARKLTSLYKRTGRNPLQTSTINVDEFDLEIKEL